MPNNTTQLNNMVDPEVLSPLVRQKMIDAIRCAPLARIDSTLTGRPGSTVKLPCYAYIGAAEEVAEGASVPVSVLSASTQEVGIKKAGKGVELSDEAMLSGYGDPIGEAGRQLGLSIAHKVDDDCLAALNGIAAPMTAGDGTQPISANLVADALVLFGEDVEGPMALLIAPAQLAALRKDTNYLRPTDLGQDILMSGAVGMLHGCQLLVSDKIKAVGGKYANYILKTDALAIYLKRDVTLETDRDIARKVTLLTADEHYAAYLYDPQRAIKLMAKAG